MLLNEAQSVYLAKLNSFLADCDKETVAFIKKCLNNIFLGIQKDFGGYVEGKRPTITNQGDHQVFSMMLQAKNPVKNGEPDNGKSWNFYDPIADYCSGLGETFSKQINSEHYSCITNKALNRDDRPSSTPDLGTIPLIGVAQTGVRGKYKNIDKSIPGNTFSIIVSVPVSDAALSNKYMTKSGDRYLFSNNYKDAGEQFNCTFDQSDNEFVLRSFRDDSADTFNIIYSGRNATKAFRELVDKFDGHTTMADVERILGNNKLRVKHSWWFNPYTD